MELILTEVQEDFLAEVEEVIAEQLGKDCNSFARLLDGLRVRDEPAMKE